MMKPERLREIAGQFSSKRLLVIGDAVIDMYVFGKVERLNPEAPVPILHAKETKYATGGAGNTAKNAAMLGAATTLISVVGDDERAGDLEKAAREEGYTTAFIRDPSRPTIEKTRFLVGSQQLLRVDHEEVHDISGDIENQVVAAIKKHAGNVDAIIVSDYAKGVVTQKVAETVMAAMKEHNLLVMADVKPSRVSYFTGASFMSPNRKEAHEYLGLNQHENGGRKPEELAAMIAESFDTTVFLTLSDQGMYVLEKNGQGTHLPVEYVKADEVLDPSGCGDTAAVALTLSKLAGASDVEAGDIANGAGATVARKIGSTGLTQEELLHTMTQHHK